MRSDDLGRGSPGCPDGWGGHSLDDDRTWIEKAYSSGDLQLATKPEGGCRITPACPPGYQPIGEPDLRARARRGRRYSQHRRLAS